VTALARWRDELAGWAIPPEILEQAPEPPWGFPVAMFQAQPDPADSPSRRRAAEALDDGGAVLDVGCGGGSAAMALVPPARRLIGVDSAPDMLAAFAAAAGAQGVEHEEHAGAWPAVSDQVPVADVVVCHHVFYNVAEVAAGPQVHAAFAGVPAS